MWVGNKEPDDGLFFFFENHTLIKNAPLLCLDSLNAPLVYELTFQVMNVLVGFTI